MGASIVVAAVLSVIAAAAWRRSWRRHGVPPPPAPTPDAPSPMRARTSPLLDPDQWRIVLAPTGLKLLACTRRELLAAGRRDGFEISVRFSEADGSEPARVAVAALRRNAIPQSFAAFAAEGPPAEAALGTGDAAFDREVEVRGSPLVVHAMLGASERAAIRRHVARTERSGGRIGVQASIAHGAVQLDLLGTPSPQAALDAVEAVLQTARALTAEGALAARVVENARHDSLPLVRARCMGLLADRMSGLTARQRGTALRQGLQDPDAEVRYEAARGLGADGEAALLALARSGTVSSSVRVRSVAAMRQPPEEDVARAITLAGATRVHDALTLAESLASRGDARVAPLLLAALGRARGRSLLRAVRMAGEAGSLDAVPRLVTIANDGNAEVRRVAGEAIARIQERLGALEPGRLSLAEAAGGGELTLPGASSGGELAEPARSGDLSEPSARDVSP